VFKESGMIANTWITNEEIEYFYDKTPSDVYSNMWKITTILKAILSNQGVNLNHAFTKADYLVNKLNIINNHFTSILVEANKQAVHENVRQNKLNGKAENIDNKDLLTKALYLNKVITQIKTQQGLPTKGIISSAPKSDVKISDIYSELWQLDAGLSELELFLDIDKQIVKSDKDKDKKLADVYQKLLIAEEKLMMLSRYFINVNTRKQK
jgi:hypothetical protein